jgi:prepilin-type N-terminal cleavage/methylation domain-containing protein
MWATKKQTGFTIVELLIVIVIIGILAAITIVAYNGIQGRANDAAVQNDLRGLADQFQLYYAENGVYPVGSGDLSTMHLKVSKGSYGFNVFNGANAGRYDLLYCRVSADGPDKFALIASSKSGNLFTYQSTTGVVAPFTGTQVSGSNGMCQAVGINQISGTDRDIFYESGAWHDYVGG